MSVRPPRLTGVGLSHPHVCACACTRVWACAYACVHACVWACVCACACAHTCACAYPRVYARRRVRMGACAYMRGYGTVCGGGMRLSDVGSCLVIVAWCNCCMCNYMGMVSRRGLCGLTVLVVVMVVSTRRGMLVVAMVLVVVCDTDLHSVWGACIVIAINHGTTRREP